MTEEISCATLKILALPVYGSKDVGVLYHESILPMKMLSSLCSVAMGGGP